MNRRIGTITIFVSDQDEAKTWYADKLGFKVVMDDACGEGQRWVALAYPGQEDVAITLVKADSTEYKKHLGGPRISRHRNRRLRAGLCGVVQTRGEVFRKARRHAVGEGSRFRRFVRQSLRSFGAG